MRSTVSTKPFYPYYNTNEVKSKEFVLEHEVVQRLIKFVGCQHKVSFRLAYIWIAAFWRRLTSRTESISRQPASPLDSMPLIPGTNTVLYAK